jgi:hypothetical protein
MLKCLRSALRETGTPLFDSFGLWLEQSKFLDDSIFSLPKADLSLEALLLLSSAI